MLASDKLEDNYNPKTQKIGVRCHGYLTAFFLSLMNKVTIFKDQNNKIYLNKNSYAKWLDWKKTESKIIKQQKLRLAQAACHCPIKKLESKPAAEQPIEVKNTKQIKIHTRRLYDDLKRISREYTHDYHSEASSRFREIGCPKNTAIKVNNKILHANHMVMRDNIPYIAAQAPLELDLFWEAVLDRRALIVDLTNQKDYDVHPYYPGIIGENCRYGAIEVSLKEKSFLDPNIEMHRYSVKKNHHHRIYRLHFTGWPDAKAASLEKVMSLIDRLEAIRVIRVEKSNSESKSRPYVPLIHCRAGVGRTGTLITLLTIKHLIDANAAEFKKNAEPWIKETILHGRKCRSHSFVQTREQLQLIIDCAEYWLRQKLPS